MQDGQEELATERSVPGPKAEESRMGRQMLVSLGVPDEALTAAEQADLALNWMTLILALDRIFLAYGGMAAQASFLREAQPELAGRAPIHVLKSGEEGAVAANCEAAHAYVKRGPLSK